jgi:uncharacterized tellurite resistance protein B-like protein
MFYEKLSAEEQGALLYFANEVIRADGLVTPEEMAHLQKLLGGVASGNIISTAQDAAHIFAGAKNSAKKGVYIELLSLALSDGIYDETEQQCMKKIQAVLELSDDFAKNSAEWLLSYIDVIRQGQKLVAE